MIQRPIYTSSASWREVPAEKRQLTYELGKFLEDKINLETFGTGLKAIWFVALIMLPEQEGHTNKIIFHRKTKTLEVFWRMDYARVMAATIPEFKAYVGDFFIEVLLIASIQKKIKEFEINKFIKTLEDIVLGWVNNEKGVAQAL